MGSPRPPAARMFIVPEGVTPEVPPLRPSLPAGSAIFVTLYHITDPRGFVQLSSLRGGYATRRRMDRVQRRAFFSHVPPAGYIPPPLGESAFVTTVAPPPTHQDVTASAEGQVLSIIVKKPPPRLAAAGRPPPPGDPALRPSRRCTADWVSTGSCSTRDQFAGVLCTFNAFSTIPS